ncbi:MAG TPA: CCA tRNA nucleotidyltransferase [Myxococcota bacterium]|nr:CCA tRNA nucleotidyltransferase [Myxococcota bacterium]
MNPSASSLVLPEAALAAIPRPMLAVCEALACAGFETVFVGGCVRDLVRGASVRDFDLATAAPPEVVLELFPRAVPTGIRHGTVMIPTKAGPVDVTTFRAGARLEDDLARRDFTVNAMALEPRTGRLVDPFGGSVDLRAGRLAAVGDARARLDEDPLRALRAARLVATLGLHPAPELRAALGAARRGLEKVARERLRQELTLLFSAPGPGAAAGLVLLRESGIEADLAPGAAADAPEVLAGVPSDLALRLAAWLRGARAGMLLARLRFPRRVVERVCTLLAIHPLETNVDGTSDSSVRRLLKRAGEANVDALLTLREAELSAWETRRPEYVRTVRGELRVLRAGLARVQAAGHVALQRLDLAVDGRFVMEVLGCAPGPEVGGALRFLTDRVLEDPARNTPEALRALLLGWAGANAKSRSSRLAR